MFYIDKSTDYVVCALPDDPPCLMLAHCGQLCRLGVLLSYPQLSDGLSAKRGGQLFCLQSLSNTIPFLKKKMKQYSAKTVDNMVNMYKNHRFALCMGLG